MQRPGELVSFGLESLAGAGEGLCGPDGGRQLVPPPRPKQTSCDFDD